MKLCLTDLLFLPVFNFLIYLIQGNTYSGQFVFGKLHGHKVLQYKGGGKYEGELFYGMRQGKFDSE